MTQEEKQLLHKDISARLFYGVKAEARGWDEEKEEEVLVPVTVYSVNTDGYVYFADNDYDITYCSIDACRLYLRQMSSMTEEEEIYYNTIYTTLKFYEKEDWLNEHHFDYRGLIPMGLALEAPEDMYKIE